MSTLTQSNGKPGLFPISLLLDVGGGEGVGNDTMTVKENEIKEKLRQFKIDVMIEGLRIGPSVTQFRIVPQAGVKYSKIVNLKKDLTLALHAKSIRIQAPIPGEGVVGIEVPNSVRTPIGLKEILTSNEFLSPKVEIPFSVGKDVSGNIIVGDLMKMPHLLVAGQTASGKSVGMNSFIVSMLYRFDPTELKFIMIDPKKVELSVYNGIPHLLTPVITEPDKAHNSLKWVVAEMLRRRDLVLSVNAKNLLEYNQKAIAEDKLAYIVIIIDELADLMMGGYKNEIEHSIARIAQMSRAVGIHLIVATQSPSVDVITGIIKANFPSRIAFTVASQIDSRAIIDTAGAEDLLGVGDMLYFPTGVLDAQRVQGVFISTEEIEGIVSYIKTHNEFQCVYDETIIEEKMESNTDGSWDGGEIDSELIDKAIQIVRESKKCSTCLIQRRMVVGYVKATKIINTLESLGVVGPSDGKTPRKVFE